LREKTRKLETEISTPGTDLRSKIMEFGVEMAIG
jgi:hypothetical protein